jgi:hypothetical protein
MKAVNRHLSLPGSSEAAFNFYRSVVFPQALVRGSDFHITLEPDPRQDTRIVHPPRTGTLLLINGRQP